MIENKIQFSFPVRAPWHCQVCSHALCSTWLSPGPPVPSPLPLCPGTGFALACPMQCRTTLELQASQFRDKDVAGAGVKASSLGSCILHTEPPCSERASSQLCDPAELCGEAMAHTPGHMARCTECVLCAVHTRDLKMCGIVVCQG